MGPGLGGCAVDGLDGLDDALGARRLVFGFVGGEGGGRSSGKLMGFFNFSNFLFFSASGYGVSGN